MTTRRLDIGDYVLDIKSNKTGQIKVEDSDTVYVQFPNEEYLIEYDRNSKDIVLVGIETPMNFITRLLHWFKPKIVK